MANFLTVAAKHCRQAEHSPQLAAGSFNNSIEVAGRMEPTIQESKGEISQHRMPPKMLRRFLDVLSSPANK